jgi:large subunit ribosomal protein L10
MPNIVNRMVVREYAEDLKDASGLLVVNFSGLTMAENESIRDRLAEKDVPFRMMRNNLLRRVLAERGLELDAECLTGNTGVAWGDAEAAINAAKVFTDPVVKKLKKVKIKGALLDGDVLGAAEANQLANVPDKDTLRGMLLGVISGPARGLATVINAVPCSVARVLQARIDEDPASGDCSEASEASEG